MPRSTFWRSKRVGKVNMYLPLDPRGKQLILIPKKLLRTVGILSLSCICLFVILHFLSLFRAWREPFLITSYLAAPVVSQVTGPFQSSGAVHDSRYVLRPDSLSRPENAISFAPSAYWTCNSGPSVNVSHITKGFIFSLPFLHLGFCFKKCVDSFC